MRWWLAIAIASTGVIALAGVWFYPHQATQSRNLLSYGVVFLTLAALFFWACLLSRFSLRTRGLIFLASLAAATLGPVLFRLSGVTGDFVPQLEWRWGAEVAPQTPAAEVAARAPVERPAPRADYPQFRGPGRDGRLDGPKLARDWSARPPVELWRIPMGPGWSAFAVAGDRAVTQEQRGDVESVTCYRVQDGRLLWSHGDETAFRSVIAGDGPRATPTIDGARVFTMGSTGVLNCLSLEDGNRLWTHQVVDENNTNLKFTEWGKACSPLIVGDLVVVSAGSRYDRSLVAYDRTSGVPVWWGGKDYSSYSSPIVTALLDARQILIFNKGSLAAHDPATGQVLWQVPWPDRFPNVIQPVPVENDKVFLSSGYGVGAGLVQIFRTEDDGWDTKMLWQNIEMKAKFSPVVKRDEFVYGFDDGILACLNVFSGRQRWKRGRYGHGQIILVDDLLLVQTERGELCLVAADPAEFRELTPPFPVFDRKTWNSPALAGRYAFLRNDREAVCLELPLAE